MSTKTLIPAVLIISCFFIFSCHKDNPARETEDLTLEDSVALLQGKWKLIKDSLTNTGNYYFMENGTAWYPTPGVYFGTAADYFEFLANGAMAIHENQQTYNSQYQLFSNNQLVIKDLLVHDTGSVITLTAVAATFDWSNTSPNGGQYFRRIYLKK
jgi:hypothetical protein